MISTNDFKTGMTVKYNDGIWQVIEFLHVKPGKGSAFVRTKLKNVETGNQLEVTFRAGEKLPVAVIDKADMQYLYKAGDAFTFMDSSTYDQMEMEEEQIGDQCEFLKEGQEGITVLKYEGKVIGVELPTTVELEIQDTAPDERGDTSSGGGKPATLETGATITVPFHIKIGDVVKVDTRTRKYVTRV